MEEIKELVKIICLSALLIGIVNSFVNNKSQAKAVNLVTGLIFLMLVISPFIKNDYNFDMNLINNNIDTDYSDLTDTVNKAVLKETEEKLKNLLIEELEEKGLKVKNFNISCISDKDGSVSIEKIECEVYENSEHATRILKERIGNEDCLIVTQSGG